LNHVKRLQSQRRLRTDLVMPKWEVSIFLRILAAYIAHIFRLLICLCSS
jgi:hypothetical protein